jgi:hypothetical protein
MHVAYKHPKPKLEVTGVTGQTAQLHYFVTRQMHVLAALPTACYINIYNAALNKELQSSVPPHLLIDARRWLSRQHLSALAGAGSLLCAALAAHRLATADVCGCMTNPAGTTRIVKQGRLAEPQRASSNNRAMVVQQGR